MAFLMTALVTWLDLGFPPNDLWLWLKAFVIAWPAAAIAAVIAIPLAHSVTAQIVRFVDRA